MTDWLEELLALAGEREKRGEPFPLPLPVWAAPLARGEPASAGELGPASGPEEGAGAAEPAWLFQGVSETGPVGGAAMKTGRRVREALSGLEGLYRRAAEAALAPSAAHPAPPREPDRAEAPAAGLTAEELDRAVRRDSRRYDGGMSIY